MLEVDISFMLALLDLESSGEWGFSWKTCNDVKLQRITRSPHNSSHSLFGRAVSSVTPSVPLDFVCMTSSQPIEDS